MDFRVKRSARAAAAPRRFYTLALDGNLGLYLHRYAKWELRHAYRRARVQPNARPVKLENEIGKPVYDRGSIGKTGCDINHAEDA